jgi:hypothetical protein
LRVRFWIEQSIRKNAEEKNVSSMFRIDVTFEMRTVLSRICLFNDTILNIGHHFILNGKGGEESKIVERQRECVCV